MPFLTEVTVSQETWYSWSFLNIYKETPSGVLFVRRRHWRLQNGQPTMLNSMSHTLTASWLFYNLLVWAVFCKINLWKHSFEFEDYKKAYYALFTCYNKLTTSQNIFVCSGFFCGYTIFSSQTRPSDQIPLGTASTVKTHSLFDLQFVALKVPVRWVKPTLITGMSS